MIKVKVCDLIGIGLDWAVESAKGTFWSGNGYFMMKNPDGSTETFRRLPYPYSTDPKFGWPIIEQGKFASRFDGGHSGDKENQWTVQQSEMPYDLFHGETLLIGSMRCFVASVFGNEIEIPEVFVQ